MPEDKNTEMKKAAALVYNEDKDVAPKVVACGKGQIAERIVELAREHGITLYEDRTLVELLVKLDLGDTIPNELYKAVAEVLAFVYRLERRALAGKL